MSAPTSGPRPPVDASTTTAAAPPVKGHDHLRGRNVQLVVGAGLAVMFIGAAALAPLVTQHGPLEQFTGEELVAPSATYWFGTDQLGRDVFSRVVYGTRASLQIGVVAVAIGAALGAVGGVAAGYFQRATETVVMRLADTLFAMPALILGIAFAAVFGSSSLVAAVAIGIATAPIFARVTRAATLTVRHREYVAAAQMAGSNHAQVILRHVVPNIAPTLLVQLAVSMGSAVLIAAGLSFLGLGTQPPTPSWGQMLNDSLRYASQAPWFGLFPGIALTLLVLALNSLADGLQHRFDPR